VRRRYTRLIVIVLIFIFIVIIVIAMARRRRSSIVPRRRHARLIVVVSVVVIVIVTVVTRCRRSLALRRRHARLVATVAVIRGVVSIMSIIRAIGVGANVVILVLDLRVAKALPFERCSSGFLALCEALAHPRLPRFRLGFERSLEKRTVTLLARGERGGRGVIRLRFEPHDRRRPRRKSRRRLGGGNDA
jgi:hypothetical protein